MSYNTRLEFEYKYEMLKVLQRIADALETIAKSTGPLIEEKES